MLHSFDKDDNDDEIKNGAKATLFNKDNPMDHSEHKLSVPTKEINQKTKILDRDMGTLRGHFTRVKVFFKKASFLDREMGTLRSNYLKVKAFFKNVFCYVKSFFTKKKAREIKAIFSYKKILSEQKKVCKSVPLNSLYESDRKKKNTKNDKAEAC